MAALYVRFELGTPSTFDVYRVWAIESQRCGVTCRLLACRRGDHAETSWAKRDRSRMLGKLNRRQDKLGRKRALRAVPRSNQESDRSTEVLP